MSPARTAPGCARPLPPPSVRPIRFPATERKTGSNAVLARGRDCSLEGAISLLRGSGSRARESMGARKPRPPPCPWPCASPPPTLPHTRPPTVVQSCGITPRVRPLDEEAEFTRSLLRKFVE